MMSGRRAAVPTPRPPSLGALVLGVVVSLVGSGVSALTQRDMARVVETFETYFLGPVTRGAVPDLSDFRPVGAINEGYGDQTFTDDERVLVSAYAREGHIGCGVDTSVNTIPVEGEDYDRFEAFLNTYADELLTRGYAEDTSCGPTEGAWGRYFTRTYEDAQDKYLMVIVSATRRFANGGLSLLEQPMPVRVACP